MKLTPFLTILNQLRVYHWQTSSYAEHKALGAAYDALDELFDKFVEVYIGKKRPQVANIEYVIKVTNYNTDIITNLSDIFNKAIEIIESMIDPNDSELANIKDEIAAEFCKLMYLLQLK